MSPLLNEIRGNAVLWLLVFVPVVFVVRLVEPGSTYAALRALCAGDFTAGHLAERRYRSGGVQDGRYGRRAAQRHVGKSDGTGHCAGCAACRPVHLGEGFHRRSDRRQYFVHVGRLVSSWRHQIPCAGVQQGQRQAANEPAVSRHDRDGDTVDGVARRFRRYVGVHPAAERWIVGDADRRLRDGPVFFTEDPTENFSAEQPMRKEAKDVAYGPCSRDVGGRDSARCFGSEVFVESCSRRRSRSA